MAQESFQDMMVQQRQQRPAECFEPGFDTVQFKSEETVKNELKSMTKQCELEQRSKDPPIKMSYQQAREAAYKK